MTPPAEPGRDNPGGYVGVVGAVSPNQILTLPGSGFFSFPDQWEPVLTTDPSGYSTPGQIPGTYDYAPVSGQRDLLGYIRAPKIGSPSVGYGSNPFIDIGAYQYVNLHPPEVTSVTETALSGSTPQNFYVVGGSAGANATPWSINITFSGPLDPNSITANTVMLTDLGSNPAAPVDTSINLAGKLTYDSATDTLIINLAAAGLTLSTDAYQIELFGSGSPVLTSPQGIALDGENTVGDSPTGAQLALPSGNGYPGGNFFDSFIINTTPPSVLAGSLTLDPASDTNIIGDEITSTTLPTFDGTVSEPNAQLVPLAGQTAILEIGVAVDVNGVLTEYFDPTTLPSSEASLAQYIRPDAGTALSGTGGAFQVTVGIDAANTGLVTNTNPLPNLFPLYNVGPDGLLSPVPGDDSGYYVARVQIIDQSGNESSPTDPNAQLPFVVDTTPPVLTVSSPTTDQVITSLNSSGEINFTVFSNKNIDQTHFTAQSIQLINAGPDGILGDADDVTIPIDPNSIKFTLLDTVTGGKGREEIQFSSEGTLTNNLYQVTLLSTGPDAVRDIAGNVATPAASQQFIVDVPALQQNFFVGGPQYITNPTAVIGTRENPYPTIGAAMTAAAAGDVVAVLPGVYTEQVTMKQFVRLLSADPTSTDSTVFTTSTGDALSTIIRAPFVATAPAGLYATVSATNVESFSGLRTEIAGFSIASPLVGDPANGSINPNSIALSIDNSNIFVDKDYIVDAGAGVAITTSGSGAMTPQLVNDVVDGNIDGVTITDGGLTSASVSPVSLINDDFVFNTVGLSLSNTLTTPTQAYVASSIFWQNHDQTLARSGFAIFSTNPNKINMQNNLFYSNGASDSGQTAVVNTVQNGFNPLLLGTTGQDALSNQGNFVGNPNFVFPVDARPGSDGPANFFLDADFQVTSASAAIDNAWEPTAITTDLLGNSQVKISGGGFGFANYGPRDIGAFEFNGTGGIPLGGAFRVLSTSLVPITGEFQANGQTLNVSTAPTSVTVTFSQNVNQAGINATDLVLSGTAVQTMDPAHATSLTWIDADTVRFNLTGNFNTSGTLSVSLPADTVQSVKGAGLTGYSDYAVLSVGSSTSSGGSGSGSTGSGGATTGTGGTTTGTRGTTTGTGSGTVGSPAPAPTPSPTPAPAPKGPLHHKKKPHVVVHPKPVKHIVVKHVTKPAAPKHKAATTKKTTKKG